jgi:trans-2-enoyl-CoA reductase
LKYKVNAEFLKQQQLEEHEKTLRTRATYLQQMEEKKNKKEIEKMRDRTYHEATMDNIARLYNRELEEAKALKDKKEVEREIRDRQIQENVEIKVNEFTVNRLYDKQISKYLLI